MKLSFVIPCYGSESTIEIVIAEIVSMMTQKPICEYEIICINDDSPDGVLLVLKRLAQTNPHLTIIDLTRNMGKPSAVLAGYSLVSGDVIVNLDDDGQCPMSELWRLIEPLDNGYDVSIAQYPQRKETLFKRFGGKINRIMAETLIDKPKEIFFTPFNAMSKYLVDEVVKYKNPYPYIDGLVLRVTRKIAMVPMNERDRISGSSNYTFFKSLQVWLNGFTAFSVKPLRLSTILGFLVSMGGGLYALYIFIRALLTDIGVPGYSSTMVALLLIGGVIMMMLGVLGEYVGRIYISINNSPQYVIRKIIKGSETDR
jgi:undecaprenyl-phosphate 4-deoxy-4-formamido-L-arabinose transferase